MEARVNVQWHTRWLEIWLYERRGGHLDIIYPTSTIDAKVVTVDLGDELPAEPSLYMSPEMVKALVTATSSVMPPSDATERHLKDAMVIRDRLLAIVETKSETLKT